MYSYVRCSPSKLASVLLIPPHTFLINLLDCTGELISYTYVFRKSTPRTSKKNISEILEKV